MRTASSESRHHTAGEVRATETTFLVNVLEESMVSRCPHPAPKPRSEVAVSKNRMIDTTCAIVSPSSG